jgi:3-phosphoglycerate kinase
LDTDVPIGDKDKVLDDTRIRVSLPTIRYLIESKCSSIVVLGHRGRPVVKNILSNKTDLSLKPVAHHLEKLLIKEFGKEKVKKFNIVMMENLRLNPAEMKPFSSEGNQFAQELLKQGEIYVNDAFGVCHREQVSVVSLPKLMPHYAGFHLVEEVEKLEKILKDPKRPVVFVLGGGKEDKAILVPKLLDHADWLLVGGLIAKHTKSYCQEDGHMCVVAAHLTYEGKDITPDSIRNFQEIIQTAGTVVWNGPMGDIDSGYWDGTKQIAQAIIESEAYKVVGGGDTIGAVRRLGLQDKFDHLSTGGGAMLEFLAYGDLPGLAALR